jgi:hypothetical protein
LEDRNNKEEEDIQVVRKRKTEDEARKYDTISNNKRKVEGSTRSVSIIIPIIKIMHFFRRNIPANALVGNGARTPCAILIMVDLVRVMFITMHIIITNTWGFQGSGWGGQGAP